MICIGAMPNVTGICVVDGVVRVEYYVTSCGTRSVCFRSVDGELLRACHKRILHKDAVAQMFSCFCRPGIRHFPVNVFFFANATPARKVQRTDNY